MKWNTNSDRLMNLALVRARDVVRPRYRNHSDFVSASDLDEMMQCTVSVCLSWG
jgi:hypothetical protein